MNSYLDAVRFMGVYLQQKILFVKFFGEEAREGSRNNSSLTVVLQIDSNLIEREEVSRSFGSDFPTMMLR